MASPLGHHRPSLSKQDTAPHSRVSTRGAVLITTNILRCVWDGDGKPWPQAPNGRIEVKQKKRPRLQCKCCSATVYDELMQHQQGNRETQCKSTSPSVEICVCVFTFLFSSGCCIYFRLEGVAYRCKRSAAVSSKCKLNCLTWGTGVGGVNKGLWVTHI